MRPSAPVAIPWLARAMDNEPLCVSHELVRGSNASTVPMKRDVTWSNPPLT
jgi:hypothetical protein